MWNVFLSAVLCVTDVERVPLHLTDVEHVPVIPSSLHMDQEVNLTDLIYLRTKEHVYLELLAKVPCS